MKKGAIHRLCTAGILAALVFIFTAWLHIPSHTGYTHIGDAFVYLAGALLPWPYAIACGGIGGVLADCLTGYTLWAPGTLIIKTATALCFSSRGKKLLTLRNVLGLLPAWVMCIGGYYLYEALITGNFVTPLAGIPGYTVQCLFSTAVFVTMSAALDKFNFKSGGSKL